MGDKWEVVEGLSVIAVAEVAELNLRRDNHDGPRQYFDAITATGERAKVAGPTITGGPETWHFEFDEPFLIADRSGVCREVMISQLEGGRYAVKHREGFWPSAEAAGGW